MWDIQYAVIHGEEEGTKKKDLCLCVCVCVCACVSPGQGTDGLFLSSLISLTYSVAKLPWK